MQNDLASVSNEETKSIKDFNELEAAKTKEVNVLQKQVETKTARIGELGVQLITHKEGLDDVTKSLYEDQIFLRDLQTNCQTKATEWDVIQKLRADELLALADTIKVLNDDDALDLFKKALPTPSLLQLAVTSKALKKQALQVLEKKRHSDFRLNLISLALKGKTASFDKVVAMVDNMIALLKREQHDDNDKQEYCKILIDHTEDNIKELELSVSDLEKSIADTKEGIAALTDEIKALTEGIQTLDAQVAEATEQRKQEHADSVEILSSDNAAKQLIGIAKNRLAKFYSPTMYKAPPKRDLSEEEQITVNMGGTLAPTAAPGGIAGTGVTALNQDDISFTQIASDSVSAEAPPPPPETAAAYRKKDGESGGVMRMMDMLTADLDKEIQETETVEKEAQREYEELIRDSGAKRASDAKSVSDKENSKTDLETILLRDSESKGKTRKDAMMSHKFLQTVHGDCDWLLLNFETRKEARAGEVDSLTKAKAVLSGADYSLIQSSSVHHRVI